MATDTTQVESAEDFAFVVQSIRYAPIGFSQLAVETAIRKEQEDTASMIRQRDAALRRAALEEVSELIGERVREATELADTSDVIKASHCHSVALHMSMFRDVIRALAQQHD